MTNATISIAGEWIKDSRSECAARYPDRLTFRDGGLYAGRNEQAGFTQWDTGTWEIASPSLIRISTANDAIIAYSFSLSNGRLTFRDPEGCEFAYRKAG